jgi:hypothetical protein
MYHESTYMYYMLVRKEKIMINDWSDLEDENFINTLNDPTSEKDTREKFPCNQCNGTGNWKGGVNRDGKKKCFACNGKGYFFSSYADRLKKRQQAAKRKADRKQAEREAFNADHQELVEALTRMQWHNIAQSLLSNLNAYGSLTEKQVALAHKIVDAQAAREAARETEPKPEVDLSRVKELFDTAIKSGIKSPKLRLEGLVLSPAKAHSKNAGAIYVKAGSSFESEYYGKVLNGQFQKMRTAPESVTEALQALASDPTATAVAYGRETGVCSCCGRTLTDPESIARGIGPICADNWGL